MKAKTILILSVSIIVYATTYTVACPAPDSVDHSTRSPIKTTYAAGDVLTYNCEACYEMSSGDSSLTCTASGTWEGTLPMCTVRSYIEGLNNYIQTFYKNISQSSLYAAGYEADRAVDGSMVTMAHTQNELNPWLAMAFCVPTTVMKVVVWNRATCCSNQLSDLDIKLDGILCGHVEGSVEIGRSAEVTCSDPLTGKPLFGQILTFQKTKYDTLSLTEIEVLGGDVPCNSPEVAEHSSFYPVKTIYYPIDEVIYKCDPCYSLTNGSNSRTCIYPGSWSGFPPVCTERAPYIPEPNENIATDYNYKSVSQSSQNAVERPEALAVDGSMATISVTSTEQNPWWKMEFCTPMTISKVKIWNRVDCCNENLDDIDITFDGILCGHIDGPVDLGSSAEVTCSTPQIGGPLAGKALTIQRNTQAGGLNMAEVQTFGSNACPALEIVEHSTNNLSKTYYSPGDTVTYECDNCYERTSGDLSIYCTQGGTWTGSLPVCNAKSMPETWEELTPYYATVTQSSDHPNFRPASQAIDRSTSTIAVTNSEYNPWWSIEFCREVLVHLVYIYNRVDCCSDQLENLDVTVDGTLCGHVSGPVELGGYSRLECPGTGINGKTLKIQKMSAVNGYLTLAEVKIWTYPWAI